MSVIEQELLTDGDLWRQTWMSHFRTGVSETLTPSAGPVVGPERREVTLRLSATLWRQEWFRPLIDRLLGFLSLEANWNGYGERPIHESAVKRAIDVLDHVCPAGPRPSVVPTAEGGVQIEWVGGGFEIEVEIPPSGPADVLIVDPSGAEFETTATARSCTWGFLREKLTEMQQASA